VTSIGYGGSRLEVLGLLVHNMQGLLVHGMLGLLVLLRGLRMTEGE
jgi:hypothetical protein